MPERIGPYRVLEVIGEGGMGVVYHARQDRPIKRDVVLKLVKLGMDTKAVIARFEAERQALAMMSHPHIAKVFDAGADVTGRPYFAMEYVKGCPINKYADENHLTVHERLELFEQVCHAIQHAHQKGVIHRDVKPSNVLVGTQDGKPHSKVIDFGIAKAISQPLTDLTLYTQHDHFVGTPQYMSPEQAEGSLDIDTRTDVYSLGVMLYELLTGDTPFRKEDVRTAAFEHVKRMIREVDPPKPSTRLSANTGTIQRLALARRTEPKKLGLLVKGELDWIVMTSLEKDRARRYASAASLADDVARFRRGEPVEAAPTRWSYRAVKFVRRYKGAIAAASAIVLLLCLCLVVTAVGWASTRAALRDAKAAEERAVVQTYITNINAAQVAMRAENWPEARQRLGACPEDQRGWEWNLLSAWASAPEFGFPDYFNTCQLTPDGKLILLTSGSTATLVDMATRKRLRVIDGVGSDYRSGGSLIKGYWNPIFALGPSGTVAAQQGRSIVIFNAAGDKTTAELNSNDTSVVSDIQFSARESFCSVDTSDGWHIIDVYQGRTVASGRGSTACVDFAPHQQWIAIRDGSTGLVACRSVIDNALLFEYQPQDGWSCGVKFSPDRATIAIGTNRGHVLFLSVKDGKLLGDVQIGSGEVWNLSFDADGRHLYASANDEPQSHIVEVASKRIVSTSSRNLETATFTTDGTHLQSTSASCIWEWRMGEGTSALSTPTRDSTIVAFTADGKTMVSKDSGRVRVWSADRPSKRPLTATAGTPASTDTIPLLNIGGMTFAIDRWSFAMRQVAMIAAEADGNLQLQPQTATDPTGKWNVTIASGVPIASETNRPDTIHKLDSHDGPVRAVLAVDDGRRLLTAGEDGTIRCWDTARWAEVATFRAPAAVTGMSLARSDGQILLTRGDRAVEVWDSDLRSDANARHAPIVEDAAISKNYASRFIESNEPLASAGSHVLSDKSLSPTQRVAVLEELGSQVDTIAQEGNALFRNLKTELVYKENVQAAILSMTLTPIQQKVLKQSLDNWIETRDSIIADSQAAVDSADTPAKRAQLVADRCRREVAKNKNDYSILGVELLALYRLRDFDEIERILQATPRLIDPATTKSWPGYSQTGSIAALLSSHRGDRAKAIERLRTSLWHWGGEVYSKIQIEAASNIQPAATQPTARPLSQQAVSLDAIDATRLDLLENKVGQVVRVKGRVSRITPTRDGSGVSLLLGNPLTDLIIFTWRNDRSGNSILTFDDLLQLEGREIAVEGVVTRYSENVSNSQKKGAWMTRLQMTIGQREDIQMIGVDGSSSQWWSLANAPETATTQPER